MASVNGEGRTVFAPSRPEGTWIEGLTGIATVYPEEPCFIYRVGMLDRALAGEALVTGSGLMVDNGAVYLRFQPVPGGLPFNPHIAVYDRGEYADLLTIQDRLITLARPGYGFHPHS